MADQGKHAAELQTSFWKEVVEIGGGTAGRLCDQIVHNRDVPLRLLAALNVDRPVRPLTDREAEVLNAAANGLGECATAAKLGLSGIASVKTHRRKAIRRLGARNITHAVAISIRKGLI